MPPSLPFPSEMRIIDSHTEGEPTRTVVSGFPKLQGATVVDQRDDFAARFDHLRKALICEPRGYDAIVGALLLDRFGGSPALGSMPESVIFFNDAGYLGMCGHGTIGVAHTLRYLGWAPRDGVSLQTPVGTVHASFASDSKAISIQNVASHWERRLEFDVDGERIAGEVAYGGNWFFLHEVPLEILRQENLDILMARSKRIRAALRQSNITANDGSEIDHIEFYAAQEGGYRNFVLCPGNAYDRSPCGTGTSAKVACLAHAGALAPGETISVESVTGGVFKARYQVQSGNIIPEITGQAWITGELTPVFEAEQST